MYTAGDGFVNPLGWSIAHIACKYGDVQASGSSGSSAGWNKALTTMGGFPQNPGRCILQLVNHIKLISKCGSWPVAMQMPHIALPFPLFFKTTETCSLSLSPSKDNISPEVPEMEVIGKANLPEKATFFTFPMGQSVDGRNPAPVDIGGKHPIIFINF
jgi:hypothetical protein